MLLVDFCSTLCLTKITRTLACILRNLQALTNLTLVTPALGTPSALVLTNATALPAAQVAQGTMASGMVLVAPALGTPASGTATNGHITVATAMSAKCFRITQVPSPSLKSKLRIC